MHDIVLNLHVEITYNAQFCRDFQEDVSSQGCCSSVPLEIFSLCPLSFHSEHFNRGSTVMTSYTFLLKFAPALCARVF